MYLKRLELHGFKSFYEKTVLEFNKGITAVVGPNGSGKSNISDAISWVLGEQSAKSLRGQKMEDVIFSGTANRRGVAMAEVTLVLDNSCGSLSLGEGLFGDGTKAQSDEIAVSRRLYRSGESQYVINGVNVRLKDIHGMFMDTGVGREGYSLIGQGRIENVLSVKSEDRRALFEEAAGIIKYKSKKSEAESKLAREKLNFQRVCDIITEIESQLEPMKDMAEKARRYLELSERLKLVKVNSFIVQTAGHKEEDRKAQDNIDDLTAQLNNAETSRETKKLEASEIKAFLSRTSAQIDRLREESNGISLDIQKTEGEIKLAESNIAYIEEQKTRLDGEVLQKRTAASAGESERLAFLDKLMQLAGEMLEKEEEVNTFRGRLEGQSNALSEKEAGLEAFNSLHIERLQSASGVNSRIEGLTAAYAALEDRKDSLNDELNLMAAELAGREAAQNTAKEAIAANAEDISKASAVIDAIETKKKTANDRYTDLKIVHKAETAKLEEAKSRKKLLEELEAGYEGYQYSVKNLLKAARGGKSGLGGLHGALGELVTAAPKYETCVEIALGGAMMDIIADDEESSKRGIEYLKATKGGRATFLPLSAIKPRDLGKAKNEICSEPGILGTVSDFVETEPLYRGVIMNLLGRVIAAADINSAIAFSKKNKYAYKVVTLDGELINAGGAITGGYLGKSAGILSRRRQILELSEFIEKSEKSAEARNNELDTLSAKLSGASDTLERTKFTLHELQIRRASLEQEASQEKRVIKERGVRLDALKHQDAELLARIESVNKELHECKNLKKDMDTGISGLLTEISEKQESLQNLKKIRDNSIKALSSAESELSRLSEAVLSAEGGAARAESVVNAANEAVLSAENAIEALEIEKEEKLRLIEGLHSKIVMLTGEKSKKEQVVLNLLERYAGAEKELDTLSQYELEAMQLETRLKLELERLNNKKETLENDRRKLYDEMWDEYGITPQSALGYERLGLNPARLRQEETSLRNELRGMGGTVNLNAVEEYKLIKERHSFLIKQRDDIRVAEEQLMEVVAELKHLMEMRFKEEFVKISENFGIVFQDMFGGGTASLRLTDETDVLESGIEIAAKPPGKALQNMSLFSGGERALCAIALLFGILHLKPSPFCVLDEIDTALDDSNVRRFARFIKNYAGGTQFIVVTHRKGTMESADALYGVTMQEAGVSKLVSVKFTENENGEAAS